MQRLLVLASVFLISNAYYLHGNEEESFKSFIAIQNVYSNANIRETVRYGGVESPYIKKYEYFACNGSVRIDEYSDNGIIRISHIRNTQGCYVVKYDQKKSNYYLELSEPKDSVTFNKLLRSIGSKSAFVPYCYFEKSLAEWHSAKSLSNIKREKDKLSCILDSNGKKFELELSLLPEYGAITECRTRAVGAKGLRITKIQYSMKNGIPAISSVEYGIINGNETKIDYVSKIDAINFGYNDETVFDLRKFGINISTASNATVPWFIYLSVAGILLIATAIVLNVRKARADSASLH